MVFFNRQVFLSLHEEIIEFKVCPATQWTYLLKTGQKLVAILYEITLFYENRAERHVAGAEEDDKALARLKELKNIKLLAALHISMDILDPVVQLNIRTQGRKRLICEKRNDVDVCLRKLDKMPECRGWYEREFMDRVDFTDPKTPILRHKKGEIYLQKIPGHMHRQTRLQQQQLEEETDDVFSKRALDQYVKEFKRRSCELFLNEIKTCMSQDSLANAFGVFNILSIPAMTAETEGYDSEYGKEEIEILGDHFGSKFWALKSFKDESSHNGFMVKPCEVDPIVDKSKLFGEWCAAKIDIYNSYRKAVLSSDHMSRKYEEERVKEELELDRIPEIWRGGENGIYTQRMAYEDWVKRAGADFPNLVKLVRLMLAHIPSSVDPERNASNLKLTLTKSRNRLEYDSLNAEFQVTENGKPQFIDECEKFLGRVTEDVIAGGFSASGFRDNLEFMVNVE